MAQLLCLSKAGHAAALDLTVDSPLPFNSPDTDTREYEYEDEDEDLFFAGLTRRLTQSKSFAGVPSRRLATPPYPIEENHESTLAGTTNCLTPMGVSQFRAPLPSETERFDLAIRAAALELSNLKMAVALQEQQQYLGTLYSGKLASPFPLTPDQNPFPWTQNAKYDLFSHPVAPPTLQRPHAGEGALTNQLHDALLLSQQSRGQQLQTRSQIGKSGLAEGSKFGRSHSFPHPGWASKVVPSVPKRGCAGTGVFLPRGYGDVPLESRRTSVIVPAKVVRALNMNVQLQDRGGLSLARRNSFLMMQQRRLRPDESLNHHEPCLLPREWTY